MVFDYPTTRHGAEVPVAIPARHPVQDLKKARWYLDKLIEGATR